MSLLGGPERSAAAGSRAARRWGSLASLAFALLACSSGRVQLSEYPALDDGACAAPLGGGKTLWSRPVLAAASDGAQTFFVDAHDGHLRVAAGGAPPTVVATTLVAGAERVTWGWLAVDATHAYWIPGHLDSPHPGEQQLARVSRTGGPVQVGFQPPGPVIDVHIDAAGGLLLTEEGIWILDLRDWGKARLLRRGQYATFAADRQRIYLRQLHDPGPMDFVAHQVLDQNGCHEPPSNRIVAVDRQTGKESLLFESNDQVFFGPLAADDTHLYVAAAPVAMTADERTCRIRRLLRISKGAGAVQSRRLPAGIGGDLVQAGANLYWIDGGSGRVFRTDKEGGAVSVVGQFPCRPNRLVVGGGVVEVWRADGGACALETVAANAQVAAAPVNLEAGDALLAVGGGWVYVSNAEDQLRRISISRGTVEMIRGPDGAPITAMQAKVVGSTLYFSAPEFLGRWSSSSNEVVRVYPGRTQALATDGEQVFMAVEDGSIGVVGKSGGVRTVAVGSGAPVRDLTVANRAAYWIEGPPRGAGRALWTAGTDGLRTQLLSIDGMDQIASDGRFLYYATEGRSRILPSETELSGAIVRVADGKAREVAGQQENITDLHASPRGVFWRQRRGLRWLDSSGSLHALDCTVADPGIGLGESDGIVYWADGTARALMSARVQ